MPLSNQVKPATPTRFQKVSGLLLAFLTFSVLVHGGTFLFPLFQTKDSASLSEKRIGAAIISVTLKPAANKLVTTLPQPAPLKKPANHADRPLDVIHAKPAVAARMVKIIPAKKPETGSTNKIQNKIQPTKQPETVATSTLPTATTPIATLTTNQTSSARQQLQQQRNYLLGELQNRLTRYLSYPVRAQRRGWQGEVMISLHINELGQLNGVRLTKSSGYSLLDNSAVSAVSKLKNIDLPEIMGRLQAMDLQLPVRYELRES